MNKDEALQVIRSNFPTGRNQLCEALETLIPELKESDDEKIRKTLKSFFDSEISDYGNVEWRNGIRYGEIVSWLEKQGEQKSTDKVEPKFKVGDWIVRNNDTVIHKVVDIRPINDDGEIYGYNLNDFTYFSGPFENEYHLWTIQDAKDGDIIFSNDEHGTDSIELIKSISDNRIKFWFCLSSKNNFKDCYYEISNGDIPYTNFASRKKATPTTKEQRDLLFQKMKEAGYEWDAEKKELKKIDARENLVLDGDLMQADCMMIEQESLWSEEDDYILNLVSKFTSKGYKSHPKIPSLEFVQDWLKSLKERVQSQSN